jgi:hypothetical protein
VDKLVEEVDNFIDFQGVHDKNGMRKKKSRMPANQAMTQKREFILGMMKAPLYFRTLKLSAPKKREKFGVDRSNS